MDVSVEKESIINRIKSIDDADLIKTIKSLLDFGLKEKNINGKSLSDFVGILSDDEAEAMKK